MFIINSLDEMRWGGSIDLPLMSRENMIFRVILELPTMHCLIFVLKFVRYCCLTGNWCEISSVFDPVALRKFSAKVYRSFWTQKYQLTFTAGTAGRQFPFFTTRKRLVLFNSVPFSGERSHIIIKSDPLCDTRTRFPTLDNIYKLIEEDAWIDSAKSALVWGIMSRSDEFISVTYGVVQLNGAKMKRWFSLGLRCTPAEL